MNWNIGDEIICIKNHSHGVVKIGQSFKVQGLRSGQCPCHKVLIHVGLYCSSSQIGELVRNPMCGHIYIKQAELWLTEKLFAPLDILDISELTEILNKETIEL